VTSAERELALLEGSERRLVRLAFDLHDGALQDLAALTIELQLFRTQMAGTADRLVLGRVDDFAARVDAIERELRALAQSLSAPALTDTPLAKLVRSEVEALESAGVRVTHEIHGSVEWFTPSLRIALIRLVQAAFENIRLHSGAHAASLTITAEASRVRLEIVDDGEGFEVEPTLDAAARGGRLGLAGMRERIRLLDGRLDISSRRGGPTTISVVVPRWRGTQTPPEGPGRSHLLPVKAPVASH
jgi:two-component system, NarL family, sensor histidine kinase DegS